MNILITGSCGFIGYHLCQKLLNVKKFNVFGLDNINNYYDINLKKDRLAILKKNKKFNFEKINITNFKKLNSFVKNNKISIIINLAAQAGVRYSIENPKAYLDSNIIGFFNILETSRINNINHLIFASTSSVYGNNNNFPLKESCLTDSPLTFYAATKKSNEIMAHSYSNIYKLPITGLRFFTVYGELGRPDMALYKFVKSILNQKKLNLYNKGNHIRDFTYIEDVVNAVYSLIKKPPKSKIPFDVFNVASSNPQNLKTFIGIIEKLSGIRSIKKNMPLQKGDVIKTHGSIKKINLKTNFKPKFSIKMGIKKYLKWYLEYYK